MDLKEYMSFSPYDAALTGKESGERVAMLKRICKLPAGLRMFIAAEETAQTIAEFEHSGILPKSHRVAVAKLITLIVLGDVQIAAVRDILEKLGIPSPSSNSLASAITEMVMAAQRQSATTSEYTAPEEARESRPLSATAAPTIPVIPPLTQTVPPAAAPGPRGASRNIIDLRKLTE